MCPIHSFPTNVFLRRLHFSLLVQRKVERKERTSRRKLGRLVYILVPSPASGSAPRMGKKLFQYYLKPVVFKTAKQEPPARAAG